MSRIVVSYLSIRLLFNRNSSSKERDQSKMRFNASSMIFVRFLLQLLLMWCIVYLINHLLLVKCARRNILCYSYRFFFQRFRGTRRPYIHLLRSFGCHISIFNIGFYTTSFNRIFYRIGTSNSRLWKIWFTIGILVAFGTALTACLTLLVLPVKYIYELQHRYPSKIDAMMKIDDDIQSLTDSSSRKTNTLEDERDKLLIQPIVRRFASETFLDEK